ncbi:MAG: hypothetical protein A3I89_00295 [Candidatus Harrisonbacteria bacterium RIFCSPLOWO2_02_FULL_41_11]|uniref:Caspase family p20 domain-containing protein n=1 Tax=Candidatus Harrisonbacteria bacterium RIFCSPHIGHO2_02_FULL_42_16 TaxID=1798404 RepID=A0A1G1ZGF0_9BACT|nr:MAG: hypothetical protein A3B92_03090 [Candidatus Harrisonbacteria bacterium RIFCSPHIGHO2_02_FULL_42_16]OGY65795.1 MAG: hypothetical protein A3I89_00295 [Candidatus Harrisonbacteria bacterium RIFCSPLOWO2_02_FULL_41_11]
MHAIILMLDESELLYNKATRRYKKCFCLKNSFGLEARKLIKYLKQYLLFQDKNISILRASDFVDSETLRYKLFSVFSSHRNDNVILCVLAHGNCIHWYFGKTKSDNGKYLYYSDLEDILRYFKGKLIMVNEGCKSFSFAPHIKKMKGRYLFFGGSRSGSLADSHVFILGGLLDSWKKRKPAFPEVYCELHYNHDGWKPRIIDYLVNFQGLACPCFCESEYRKPTKVIVYPPKKRPPLRLGSDLDYLMYPK